MLANRMHELPVTPILRSGESTNRAQSLKEYSESDDADSLIRSLDALTLQAATSITPSAIVRLKPRGSELCTNAAASIQLMHHGQVDGRGSQGIRRWLQNVSSLRIRHVAPHQQSKAPVKAWPVVYLTKKRTSPSGRYQGRSDTSEKQTNGTEISRMFETERSTA
jgi:hypothetical protein